MKSRDVMKNRIDFAGIRFAVISQASGEAARRLSQADVARSSRPLKKALVADRRP